MIGTAEVVLKDNGLVVVCRTQGEARAAIIKGRLESEGIPALLQYESAGIVYGLTFDGLGEVRVLVPVGLEEEARRLIESDEFE